MTPGQRVEAAGELVVHADTAEMLRLRIDHLIWLRRLVLGVMFMVFVGLLQHAGMAYVFLKDVLQAAAFGFMCMLQGLAVYGVHHALQLTLDVWQTRLHNLQKLLDAAKDP